MHKLESFALSCGSKIHKPFIYKNYFPIIEDKFVCISKDSELKSNQYDFWDDVIFHLFPYFQKHKIKIIEIGINESKTLNVKQYSKLNRSQYSYILDKSLLYFGNYNFYANLASYFDKHIVCPHRNDYLDTFKPYWSTEKDCKILFPENNQKPILLDSESPKGINTIKPEKIAANILNSLNIDHDLHNIETVYTGDDYNEQLVDIVPGEFYPNLSDKNIPCSIRMDKNFNLGFLGLCKDLQHINIYTNTLIPTEYIKILGENLKSIRFFIDSKTSTQDVQSMQSTGIPVHLISKNKKELKKLRLKFIDDIVHEYFTFSKDDLGVDSLDDLYFLSKKNVIKHGQVYNSYVSAKSQANIGEVKDCPELWEDLSFFRIFRKSS
jgi:hypothetical protein